MDYKDRIARKMLKENLLQMNKQQLKLFYGVIVHAWASQRAFISNQNFYNLWCELNYICHEVDESFPEPYDDYELLKSFCHEHPYYFIDILTSEIVINLFCYYLDNRLDILTAIAKKLRTEDFRAAYEYSNEALDLTDDIDESISQALEHVKMFS